MVDADVIPKRYLLVLALAVVGALTAGCTGEGSSYAIDAGAICARLVADSRALYRTTGAEQAVRDQAFSRLVRARAAALIELHKLTPPPDGRDTVERMLRHFDKSQRLLRQGQRAWGKSEEAPFLIVFAAREGRKGHAVARRLGLDDCAEF